MTVTAEGDPLELAIVRTTAHDNRKIIFGSTPTIDGLSNIQRAYDQSDKRIFQVPCPHCAELFEMLWDYVGWPAGRPQEAYVVCPHCGCVIEETHKHAMVKAGEWLVTAPDVIGHAGFRLNALVSLFKNSGWGELAQKFHQAKNNPSLQMVFENTRLGKVSKLSIDASDPLSLQARVEDFSLDNLPPEVLLLTCGVDVQNDRLECCILGWSAIEQPFVLGYKIIHGSTIEPKTWQSLDRLLATKWHSPNGYDLGLEATAIDSGGTGTGAENRPQQVYNFCNPRLHRHIFAVKGVPGDGPIWTRSFTKKLGAPKLFLVRVNQGKVDVLERLAALPFLDAAGEPSLSDSSHGRNPAAFRFSNTLTGQFFEQVASERRFVKYLHNRPKIEFAMVTPGAKTEALDATNHAYIVRQAANYVSMRARASAAPRPPLRQRSYLQSRAGLWQTMLASAGDGHSRYVIELQHKDRTKNLMPRCYFKTNFPLWYSVPRSGVPQVILNRGFNIIEAPCVLSPTGVFIEADEDQARQFVARHGGEIKPLPTDAASQARREEQARIRLILNHPKAGMDREFTHRTELTSEEIIRACLAGTGTTVKIDDDLEDQISDQDIGRHRAAEALGKIDTPPNFRVAPNMFQFDRDQYELGRAAAKSV